MPCESGSTASCRHTHIIKRSRVEYTKGEHSDSNDDGDDEGGCR